ncbi:MAG: hypothetical protein ABR923_14010 [Terracidiphilus sp.]|jgi:hypothetical protein
MNQEQMLNAMGISEQDFLDFVTKFLEFRSSLAPAQLSLLERALPTISQIAQSFGPDCTVADVEVLLQIAPATNGISCICWMGINPPN